jgi:hypothetical protein
MGFYGGMQEELFVCVYWRQILLFRFRYLIAGFEPDNSRLPGANLKSKIVKYAILVWVIARLLIGDSTNALVQRLIVCEQFIIGTITRSPVKKLCVILQRVSPLYGHHRVKYLHLLSTFCYFSVH